MKKFTVFLLMSVFLVLTSCAAYAGVGETILDAMGPFILTFAVKYPVIFKIIFWMGSARIIFKPLMSLILKIVEITPSNSDNKFFAKMQASAIYKFISYLLDWSASVKLPQEKKPVGIRLG